MRIAGAADVLNAVKLRSTLLAVLLAAVTTSCCPVGKAPAPIALAIAGIDSKESIGGPPLAASALGCLQERLVSCGRFKVLERLQLDAVVEAQRPLESGRLGKLAGADWVVYGAIMEASMRVMPGTNAPQSVADVLVHLRVIRVEDGKIIYSSSHTGRAESPDPTSYGALLNRAARAAVEKLAGEIAELAP